MCDPGPAGTGGAEVRTWVAALYAGGRPLTRVAYGPVSERITGMGHRRFSHARLDLIPSQVGRQ